MGIVVIVGACLCLVLLFAANLPDWSRKLLLLAVFALPPVGVVGTLWISPAASRARIDVRAVGYDIPWSDLAPCSSTPDPSGRDGIWIGGGERWPGEQEPDLIVLPGYRSHLVELCQNGSTVEARVVAPGMRFTAAPGWRPDLDARTHFSLTPADGLFLQRVSIPATAAIPNEPDDCVGFNGGQSVRASDIIKFSADEFARDAQQRATKWRTWLIGQMERRPAPERNFIFCLDLARGLARCDAAMTDLRDAAFVWRAKAMVRAFSAGEQWNALLPDRAAWHSCSSPATARTVAPAGIKPTAVSGTAGFSEQSITALPAITLQMISHRTKGGAADVAVPLENDRFSPAAFRLSPPHTLRFARQDDRVFIFAQEPSVQIRYNDLFGVTLLRSAPEGEFSLAFGGDRGDESLVADLSSAADGLRPKLRFRHLSVRVRIPDRKADKYAIGLAGLQPEWHSLGSIISLPASPNPGSDPEPALLVAINRVSAPAGLWLISVASALLIALGWASSAAGDPWGYPRWIIIGLLSHALTFRLLLTARAVTETPNSPSTYLDFLLAACFLIVGPLVLAFPALAARRRPHFGQNRPRPNSPRVALAAACLAAATLIAAVGSIDIPTFTGLAQGVAMGLLKTALSIVAAVFLGVKAHNLAAAWVRKAAPASAVPAFGARPGRWPGRFWRSIWPSFAAGLVLLLARGMLMALGYQESAPFGLKLDVIFLPAAAGMFTALTRPSQSGRLYPSIASVLLFLSLAFLGTGFAVNDLGLWWVGAMAVVLALPFVTLHSSRAVLASAAVFLIFFIGPKLVPSEAVHALRYLPGGSELASAVTLPDPLQANRTRDHYRMLDAIAPEQLGDIPSQLAREVMIERERLRYQALNGAWREGFRQPERNSGPWLGAGAMNARPIFGETTFMGAAKSDYVYLLYLRAEYGTAGVLAMAMLYAAFVAVGALHASPASGRPFGLWALALGAGCGLFMIGGTHSLFPFSGKWSLFLSIASPSDFCLGMALLILASIEVP
jgi:hypothetical protein